MQDRAKKSFSFTGLLFLLLLTASFAGHQAGYALVTPDADSRFIYLKKTGHSYLAELPLTLCLLLVFLAAICFSMHSAEQRERSLCQRKTLKIFLFVPQAFFLFQEVCERWIAFGSFPVGLVHEKQFLAGMCMQVPFGIIAYLFAKSILSFTQSIRYRKITKKKLFIPSRPLVKRVFFVRNIYCRFAELSYCSASRAPPIIAFLHEHIKRF